MRTHLKLYGIKRKINALIMDFLLYLKENALENEMIKFGKGNKINIISCLIRTIEPSPLITKKDH